jgi:ubiquinone/menaquinone biosynthesis C-methylase UbiE
MFHKRVYLRIAWAAGIMLGLSSVASAQLASRPAEEWRKTLEQPSRVDALKVNEIIARLALRPGQVVADLGAGTGLFSVPLGKAVANGGKVYAVEVDKGFLPIIDAKAKEAKLSNVQPVLGEFTDPKVPARDVDVAFMHDVLHHVENRAGYLKAAAQYVKGGGRFVVIDYRADQSPHRDQPDLIVSEEQTTAWMKAAGFAKVEKVDLFPDKYFLIFSK